MTPVTGLLACLKGAVRSGAGWTARCPAHDDRRNSLSVHHRHGRWLLKCHAGCGWQAIVDALGADAADLFDDEKRGAGSSARPSNNRATAQPAAALSGTSRPPRSPEELASAQSGQTGLALDGYATTKRLPIHFVKSCGLSEFTVDHKPAVRVPYFGVGGEELAVRFRIALDGDRFRWKSGAKPCLYGLHRLHEAHKRGRWFWSKANRTATPFGSTRFPRSASRVPPTGAKNVMPGTWTGSRRSTSSSSRIAVAMPCGNGCRDRLSGIGRS